MQIWTPPSIKRASGGLVWTLHEKECPGSDLQAPWEMDTGVPLRVSPAFSECSSSRACELLHVLATTRCHCASLHFPDRAEHPLCGFCVSWLLGRLRPLCHSWLSFMLLPFAHCLPFVPGTDSLLAVCERHCCYSFATFLMSFITT